MSRARTDDRTDDARPDVPTPQIDFDVLDDLASFHLRAVTLALSRDLDSRMEGLPVAKGTGKISSLLLIDSNPGIRASTLATLTLRDRAAITRLIDGLEAAGLVERLPDATEGRALALHLTEAGRDLAAKVRVAIREHSDAFFHDLTATEVETLHGLLRRIYHRLVGLAP